jgi:hypothetical protein
MLNRVEQTLSDQGPAAGEATPNVEDLIRKMQHALQADGMLSHPSDLPGYETIFSLLGKISREVISMYYATRELMGVPGTPPENK